MLLKILIIDFLLFLTEPRYFEQDDDPYGIWSKTSIESYSQNPYGDEADFDRDSYLSRNKHEGSTIPHVQINIHQNLVNEHKTYKDLTSSVSNPSYPGRGGELNENNTYKPTQQETDAYKPSLKDSTPNHEPKNQHNHKKHQLEPNSYKESPNPSISNDKDQRIVYEERVRSPEKHNPPKSP